MTLSFPVLVICSVRFSIEGARLKGIVFAEVSSDDRMCIVESLPCARTGCALLLFCLPGVLMMTWCLRRAPQRSSTT
jgi:hypothetical protein